MRKLLIVFLLMLPMLSCAENFKILFLNTENIRIGTGTYKEGDIFNDGEKIYWKHAKQAMKVVSLESNRQYVMVSEDFKQRKLKSAKDFLVKNNRLSTRGLGEMSSVAERVGTKLYWIDPVRIAIDYKLDEGEYFLLKWDSHAVSIPVEDGQLVLDSSIWDGIVPHPTVADLFFHYADGEEEIVGSDILIIPLPTELFLRKR